MNWSSRNTTLITRPLSGWSIRLFRNKNAGESRSTRPTWFTTPAACTASIIRRASSRLVASGFSQNTGNPRADDSFDGSRMVRCPGAHVHRIDVVEKLVLGRHHRGATRGGEGLGLPRVGIVDGHDRRVGVRGVQHLAVVGSDEAARR